MLQDNTSFCILGYDQSWQTAMTREIIDTHRAKLGGKLFSAQTVNDALKQCRKDYLLILRPGVIFLSENFFSLLEEIVNRQQDIFIAGVQCELDYAYIRDELIFVNIPLWRANGSLPFDGKVMMAHAFKRSDEMHADKQPHTLIKQDQKMVVDDFCIRRGAGWINAQMTAFDSARSFTNALKDEFHFFDSSSLYNEMYSETKFETEITQQRADTINITATSDLKTRAIACDTVILHAEGLYTLDLIKKVKARKAIIYSASNAQLDLQRQMVGIQRAVTYENALGMMLYDNPQSRITGDPRSVRHVIIQPHHLHNIEFIKIEPVGYELERLVESQNPHESLVLDVGKFYTDPLKNYKRSKGAVPAFFQMLHVKMASRPGPSFMVGTDPNHQFLDLVQVNDQSWKYLPPELEDEVEESL